jgi:hypothetical protein
VEQVDASQLVQVLVAVWPVHTADTYSVLSAGYQQLAAENSQPPTNLYKAKLQALI